jgi:hypothetical protein
MHRRYAIKTLAQHRLQIFELTQDSSDTGILVLRRLHVQQYFPQV